MITKQCQFVGSDDRGVYVHLLHPGYDNDQIVKTAELSLPVMDELRGFMKGLGKHDDAVNVLVSALGAGEYWGANANSDDFPEDSLIHVPSGWSNLDHGSRVVAGRNWEWGYPTFYGAHAFAHHQNKDVQRAFGTVTYAGWDPVMKRVLLVVRIDRKRAKEMGVIGILDRIENGEFPCVSMGTRVPYDLCSRCCDWSRITRNPKTDLAEHKRKPIRGLSTTSDGYCQHLRFELGTIYDDGVQAKMVNLHPKFFDISFVFIGADKTSYVLAKLANHCPIRPGAARCARGCWECAIPSHHVHDVWDRDMRKTAEDIAAVAPIIAPVAAPVIEPVVSNSAAAARVVQEMLEEGVDFGLRQYMSRRGNKKPEDAVKTAFTRGVTKLSDLDVYKQAEIIKRIQSHFNNALPSLAKEEPELSKSLLRSLADTDDGFGSATSLGIVLKPREFQRISLRRIGREDLADDLDERGIEFPTHSGGHGVDGVKSIVPKLLEALMPLIASRSAFGPSLKPRAFRIVITGVAKPVHHGFDHPLMDKLSADYAAYRRGVLRDIVGLTKQAMHSNPLLGEALFGDVLEAASNGLVKTSGDVLESILGMFPSMYLNRVHMPGPVSQYVEDHVSYAGLRAGSALLNAAG